jgi:hypothetical protein
MPSEQGDTDKEHDEQDMPHGHEGSDRPGGQVGVGVGGLGGGQSGGTQSDQGRVTAPRAEARVRQGAPIRKPRMATRAVTGARAGR